VSSEYLIPDDAFTVSPEELTPQGMRQKYLTGRYNRQRYVQEFGLISEEYVPGQIYMQSTYYSRCMQSAFAELMGLYPPSPDLVELDDLVPGISQLPFGVRDFEAMPVSLTAIPVLTFELGNYSDLRDQSCRMVSERYFAGVSSQDSRLAAYSDLFEAVRDPIREALEIDTDEIEQVNYTKLDDLSDIVDSMYFENPKQISITQEDHAAMLEMHSRFKIETMSDADVTLYLSKLMDRPIKLARQRIRQMLGYEEPNEVLDKMKLMMYNAHDTQASRMLHWLNPTNLSH